MNGVVTSSWGLPLVPFRFYKVDDGTGEVTVLSDSSRDAGEGRDACASKDASKTSRCIGGRPLGLHLREDDLYVQR